MSLEQLDKALTARAHRLAERRPGQTTGTDHYRLSSADKRTRPPLYLARRGQTFSPDEFQLLSFTLQPSATDRRRRCGDPSLRRWPGGGPFYRRHLQLSSRSLNSGWPALSISRRPKSSIPPIPPTVAWRSPSAARTTHWIGDQLNHNSIIRAMRIAGVPSANKGIYAHNDMDELRRCLDAVGEDIDRVVVIFDGIFSMRGDYAPIDAILCDHRPIQPEISRRSHHRGRRFPRHRRLWGYRQGHIRIFRRQPGYHHRHLRQGLRGQWRFYRRKRNRHRNGAAKGGYLYLHQSLKCRRLCGGNQGP